ncbi:MAG: helix-turn-helix transcriptional regulator [Planctomycetes bacterium]|nr:helix-turn-helix transcriptional regulator [Planctomycetota bacterium]
MSTKPLSLLSVGRMVVDASWAAARHSHPFIEMMVINGGALEVRLGEQTLRARTGDVLLYPPGIAHAEHACDGASVDFAFFAYRGEPKTMSPLVHDSAGRMRLLAAWLEQERSTAYDRRTELLDAILVLLIAEYDRLCVRREPTLADAIRAFLREHLAEALTVDDLAAHAHMSRAHFIRTYKRAAGRTPMDELRVMRVEAARDLIITSDLPLKTIADRVGLGDEQHLSHVFRRLMRVAPGYYRKRG